MSSKKRVNLPKCEIPLLNAMTSKNYTETSGSMMYGPSCSTSSANQSSFPISLSSKHFLKAKSKKDAAETRKNNYHDFIKRNVLSRSNLRPVKRSTEAASMSAASTSAASTSAASTSASSFAKMNYAPTIYMPDEDPDVKAPDYFADTFTDQNFKPITTDFQDLDAGIYDYRDLYKPSTSKPPQMPKPANTNPYLSELRNSLNRSPRQIRVENSNLFNDILPYPEKEHRDGQWCSCSLCSSFCYREHEDHKKLHDQTYSVNCKYCEESFANKTKMEPNKTKRKKYTCVCGHCDKYPLNMEYSKSKRDRYGGKIGTRSKPQSTYSKKDLSPEMSDEVTVMTSNMQMGLAELLNSQYIINNMMPSTSKK